MSSASASAASASAGSKNKNNAAAQAQAAAAAAKPEQLDENTLKLGGKIPLFIAYPYLDFLYILFFYLSSVLVCFIFEIYLSLQAFIFTSVYLFCIYL